MAISPDSMSSTSRLPSSQAQSTAQDLTVVTSAIARLRAEHDGASDHKTRAILLHEIGVLEERVGDETESLRNQLGALNATQLGAFAPTQLGALSTLQFQSLSNDQLASLSTTQRYTHVATDQLLAVYDRAHPRAGRATAGPTVKREKR